MRYRHERAEALIVERGEGFSLARGVIRQLTGERAGRHDPDEIGAMGEERQSWARNLQSYAPECG
jgi:hypothetical protein